MATIREPSPVDRNPDSLSSMADSVNVPDNSADPSDTNSQVPQSEISKRRHTQISEAIADDAGKPTKVRTVDQDDHEDASSREVDDGPTQGHNNSQGYFPIWTPDIAALGPIIWAPAWPHPAPPISPFFPVAGTVHDAGQRSAVLERWVLGRQHNKLQIFALAPVEIWLEIINRCDDPTIWSLRNSCRTMMNLCEDATLDLRCRMGMLRPSLTTRRKPYPWWGKDKYLGMMRAALNKQQFCQPCQEYWRKWSGGTFPNRLPKPSSWLLDPQNLGSLPVCEHLSITAENVKEWWNGTPTNPFTITCEHETHNKYCKASGRPSITVWTIREYPDVRFVECHDQYFNTVADVEWEAAILTLSYDEDGTPVERLSYTALRDMIWAEASKADSGLPRLLCPHLSWKDHSLLQAFDPTFCSCLDTGNVPMHEVQERHDPAYCGFFEKSRQCCLCQMAKGGKTGVFLPEGQVGGQYMPHDAYCPDCSTRFIWTRRLDQQTNKWRLWLNMKCRIRGPQPLRSSSWLHRIDPSTFVSNFAKDEKLKHRIWCDNAGCATSYRARKLSKLPHKYD